MARLFKALWGGSGEEFEGDTPLVATHATSEPQAVFPTTYTSQAYPRPLAPTRVPFNVHDLGKAINTEIVFQDPIPQERVIPQTHVHQHDEVRDRVVKVPVQAQIEADSTLKKVVSEPRQYEDTVEEWVEEEYFETEYVKRVREKTEQVQQTIQEEYTEPVQVRHTRRKPVTRQVQRTVMVDKLVEIPTIEHYCAPGFRVDEVEDTNLIQEEITQTIEYQAHGTGEYRVKDTRDLGRLRHHRLDRRVGTEVIPLGDPSLNDVSDDSDEDAPPTPPDAKWRVREEDGSTGRRSLNEETNKRARTAAESDEEEPPKNKRGTPRRRASRAKK